MLGQYVLQAPVVQKVDFAIPRINHYPVDSAIGFPNIYLGPVAQSLVSTNHWLRGIKMYRFPWYLTLVSTNHASSNPGLLDSDLSNG